MPILPTPAYRPSLFMRNGHIHTIYCSQFRNIEGTVYERERIDTPDGDFLDLDWMKQGSDRLVIVLHGLEGSADRTYVRGMMRHFTQQGWDGLAFNFRSCSGEMNRLLRVYHSGDTEDVRFVIQQLLEQDRYREIVLVGFSMGANIALKYAGEESDQIPKQIKRIVAISAPCDLASCSAELNKPGFNRVYLKRFMSKLNAKLAQKLKAFPDQIQLPNGRMPKDFAEFDGWFTAPIHGFKDAEDYWARASSLPLLTEIRIPALILSAEDDSFLGDACYPYEIALRQPMLQLEVTRYGGHVGFAQSGTGGVSYAEQRAWDFVNMV